MCPCRGRRRGRRWISEVPSVRCFLPEGCPRTEALSLTLEELEAVRLVDLLDLDQEEAAFYMGISRKALWNDLMNARHKIAAALVYGMGLLIEGGSFVLRGEKGPQDVAELARQQNMQLVEREMAILQSRRELLASRLESLKRSAEADSPPEIKG
ncbi:MAG: DUF134 domain-containing protein [Methanothrix sp.]|nr:DUF134 domain-containing protein [Methanothrix sp.]HNU39948.1 DUF134 domain-containing protein [Methanothrix sp.]HPH48209.1 DUF134 domain-containing protein [Methanothrix sp.]